MIGPIEARAATTETSKLSLNLLFRALWLLGEEIAFATNEMLDRGQTETHLFGEYLSKMAEAHSVNDIMTMYTVCGQHQIDFVRRDCERLFTHAQRLIGIWSRLGQVTG
jgi:hypothetical protein